MYKEQLNKDRNLICNSQLKKIVIMKYYRIITLSMHFVAMFSAMITQGCRNIYIKSSREATWIEKELAGQL